MKFQIIVAAALCLPAGLSAAPDPAQTAALVDYLGHHAIPLKSVQAGSGFEDLKPLRKILKDVRIVGLGEGTHGTREFFQFKHRMLEFLVKEMGFTVFGLEASYVACLNINDYVVYGKGDPAAALASQKFWTWDTQEVRDMIEWMRQYNKDLPEARRIRFMGFDIAAYQQAFDVIGGYLKKVSPDYLSQAEAAFQPLRINTAEEFKAFGERTAVERNAEVVRLLALMDYLERFRFGFVKQSSEEEFERILQHARILFQFHAAYSKYAFDDPRLGQRDRYMAENIRYLMNTLGPGTKMVVWTHNGHAADDESQETMGYFLRQWYGPDYYILGSTFNRGSFQSLGRVEGEAGKGPKEFTLPAAPENSLAWYFERARQGRNLRDYLVDFRSAPDSGPVAERLSAPMLLISIGSLFSSDWPIDRYLFEVPVRKQFDGMVFIESTTRARPNPPIGRPGNP